MKAGAGISRNANVREAAGEAARRALADGGLTRASCLVVAATPEHLDESIELVEALREVAGEDVRIVGGATGTAAILGDAEQEQGPVLAVLALDGGGEPFVVRDGTSTLPAGSHGTAAVFADPSAPLNRLIATLRRTAPQARVAGGGVSVEGGLLYDDDVIEADAVGLLFDSAPRIAVAQSHQPIGNPLLVTRAEGRAILELDGKPAVEALSMLAEQPGMSQDALRFLALGVSPQPGEPFRADDFLTVPLLGVDDDRGSLESATPVAEGTSVSFTLRDGMGARRTLSAALTRAGSAKPACGIYFDCASRGSALHGTPGLDLRLIEQAYGPFPLLSLRTSFELGPSGTGTGVHLFTGVLALADP